MSYNSSGVNRSNIILKATSQELALEELYNLSQSLSFLLIDDKEKLSQYSFTCDHPDHLPAIIIFPQSTKQIIEILKIANFHQINCHTVSRGKNWGYGCSSPFVANSWIIDLSQMNKILEVNEELKYAVVEPGVTQLQLYDFLMTNHPSLRMDVTGSTPEASLIGNLSERGYGQSHYGDHFLNSCSMEVILADGTIFNTSFGHYSQSKSQYLYKWGIGPYLDGLFTQSNFGIITKVGIWLMPKPEFESVLFLEIDSDSALGEVVKELRDLKLSGLLPSTIHIANDIRVISSFQQFPFEQASSQNFLTNDEIAQLSAKWLVKKWNCFTIINGHRERVLADQRKISESLQGNCKVSFVDEPLKRTDANEKIVTLYNLLTGRPSVRPSLGPYWRKKNPAKVPYDPPRDKCGIIWCAPIIPSTSKDIANLISLVRGLMNTFSIDTNITISLISDRACCATIAIVFDKENEQETNNAHTCYKATLSELVRLGYIPYRHGINIDDGINLIFNEDDSYWEVCRRIKNCIDPMHILSPGKYGIY
jgi:4-cresol dehydrogenase (hydroxylating)